MSIGKLEVVWQTYCTLVIPHDAPAVQIRESKRAFFAGAEAIFGLLMTGVSSGNGDEVTAEDEKHVSDIHNELLQFGKAVKEGRA